MSEFDLVREGDILVKNYSSGVTRKLGIDHEEARQTSPGLVYTSISGFGSTGGNDVRKAMDTIILISSGVIMTAGKQEDPPVRFGLPIGDLVAPMYPVIGTLAATFLPNGPVTTFLGWSRSVPSAPETIGFPSAPPSTDLPQEPWASSDGGTCREARTSPPGAHGWPTPTRSPLVHPFFGHGHRG